MVPAPLGRYEGRLWSPLASLRLRCLNVAPELARQGLKGRLFLDHETGGALRSGDFDDCDAVVFHKTFFDLAPLASALAARGIPAIVDVIDDPILNPRLRFHYPAMIELAAAVTTCSEMLAARISGIFGRPVTVVPDGVEGASGIVAAPGVPARLLWFGRSDNIRPLLDALPGIAALAPDRVVSLEIVTDWSPPLRTEVSALSGGLAVRPTEWTPNDLDAAFERSDLVVLPTPSDPLLRTKSANRLELALWRGRAVAAQPHPSHAPYRDAIAVADQLAAAVAEALADPALTAERTRAGQSLVTDRAGAGTVLAAWRAAIVAATGHGAARPAAAQTALRLNLGCGDKLLPGYTNVDVAPARGRYGPDVVADLRDLGMFQDGSVDEILSVHVIEHFHRWEVEPLLAEWLRVLRPGGRLVLECPNIAFACAAAAADPETLDGEGPSGETVMWSLYGDPSHRDPLMVHRWGYSPSTLARILRTVGFAEVREEAARYKAGPPRDMRLVAVAAPARHP